MVEVKYIGGLGNRLFQYCLGRIIAERLGFKLKAAAIPGFPGTHELIEGEDFSDGPIQELRGQVVDFPAILAERSARRIVLHGYFQRYEYYQPFKEAIRKRWLVPDGLPVAKRPAGEMVLNIRRGDYIQLGWATPFEFYREVLESAGCERLFIVTDEPGDPFFRRFKKYRPEVFHRSPLEDFSMLLSFDRMVISESTFSWWAAFLSQASEIIVPGSKRSLWSGNVKHLDVDMRINLEVSDEPRFTIMPVRGRYRPNLPELIFNARHYRARLRARWNQIRNGVASPGAGSVSNSGAGQRFSGVKARFQAGVNQTATNDAGSK